MSMSSESTKLCNLDREEEPHLASVRYVEPVVRFCAVITRHPAARQWALERLSDQWGSIQVMSSEIPFEAGGYYTPTMGAELTKTMVAFDGFQDPAGLSDWKHQTNDWEIAYAAESNHPEPRPLNLDPGYTTQAKLVLATTKDRDHRIYLKDGHVCGGDAELRRQTVAAPSLVVPELSHRGGGGIRRRMPAAATSAPQGNQAIPHQEPADAPQVNRQCHFQ